MLLPKQEGLVITRSITIYPLQKLEGLINTIEIVTELAPDRIAFYSYAYVPWVRPGQRRYTEAHLPSPELKAELYQTGKFVNIFIADKIKCSNIQCFVNIFCKLYSIMTI